MDKKMTSGEIAKMAGVSQKAIRLYDEKGLLKPSDYSEGNYRLYDKEALLVLEKIIALKKIGFSLEEIHDNLVTEKNTDITESLNYQLKLMEAKKAEIERTIRCIKSVLARGNGQADWNSVAEIARMIQMDQGADERHFKALKHTIDTTDWYVKIYKSLDLKNDARVLDLGCGYGKLWRNNWTDMPPGVKVDAYDLHGSWADNFAKYIENHKTELASGTQISITWEDVESEEMWSTLAASITSAAPATYSKSTDAVSHAPYTPYTHVVAHYLLSFLKDKELFIQRSASILTKGGMFSCNGYEISYEDTFWKQVFEEINLNSAFISEKMIQKQKQHDEFKMLLEKYFERVESVKIQNYMKYENVEELFERLNSYYPEKKKYFIEKEKEIKDYFDKLIQSEEEVVITTDSEFWHCYK